MPLYTITMRSKRRGPDKGAISAAIRAATTAAGYPENDFFQRFLSLEAEDLRIDPTYPELRTPRSDEVMMVEVVVSSGTEAERKHTLLAALIDQLGPAGVDANDAMVFFSEVDRASSSFGNGELASPVVMG
jgi:hypothetical protein